MPVPTITGLGPEPSFNDVVNKIGSLVNELRNVLLTLDDANFDRITANVMDVNELSAITANLGTITAGLLQAVSIISSTITGSLIQTDNSGVYPRIELSSANNLLTANADADNSIKIDPTTMEARLALESFGNGTQLFQSLNNFDIVSATQISINSGSNIILSAGNLVMFDSWSEIYNSSSGRTLQQDLDSLSARISALESA